jgi:hypothetical protein
MGINSAGYNVKMKQVMIDSPFDQRKGNNSLLLASRPQHDSSLSTLE